MYSCKLTSVTAKNIIIITITNHHKSITFRTLYPQNNSNLHVLFRYQHCNKCYRAVLVCCTSTRNRHVTAGIHIYSDIIINLTKLQLQSKNTTVTNIPNQYKLKPLLYAYLHY